MNTFKFITTFLENLFVFKVEFRTMLLYRKFVIFFYRILQNFGTNDVFCNNKKINCNLGIFSYKTRYNILKSEENV